MQLGKHVYVEKPLTHDIYEARILTQAEKKYKVVTQMGNQGSSGDDTRNIETWIQAGLIGDVHTVHVWTNRPVWPQGISRPTGKFDIPQNWIGIFGWEQLRKEILIQLSSCYTGGVGLILEQAHLVIWVAIL